MKDFRIIGIRLLQGCSPAIAKILKQNKTFFFCEGYKERKHSLLIERDAERAKAVSRIYDVKGAGDKNVAVNISAIVGKNGDGKSSIVEVIIRILNNLAWLLGFRADQSSLMWVQGLRAVLYVESDGHIITIVCRDDMMMCYIDNNRLKLLLDEKNHLENKKRFMSICKEQNLLPFYTMVINYSLYAYNSDTLKLETSERKSWIDELFHKNDSYQTPVVLNPMREDDSIDIKREERLCRQRMMAMFCSAAAKDEQLTVNNGKLAIGFAFALARYNKFYHYLFEDFYSEYGGVSYSWPKLNKIYTDNLKEEALEQKREDLIRKTAASLDELLPLVHNNAIKDLLKKCRKELKVKNFSERTDTSRWLAEISSWRNKEGKPYEGIDRINATLVDENFTWMNYALLYRLALVHRVWNMLSKKYSDAFDITFEDALMGREANPRCAAMLYAVYKVLSIAKTYKPWRDDIHMTDDTFTLLDEDWKTNGHLNNIIGQLEKMLDDTMDNYVSLKFRQAINYLRYSTIDYEGTADNTYKDHGFDHFVNFEALYKSQKNDKHGERLSEIMPYLLPPSFEGEIILSDNDKQYPMSMLSSGEMQMINTVSSMVYHLRNLDDSVAEKNKVQYQHVNIILEEIELYFHPNYQKQYVKYLLEQIEQTQLRNINAINIIFVTHSPFILSDITRSNMLCLEDGDVKDDVFRKETFAANIYELLSNQFFMDSYIGDFAMDRIDYIVSRVEIMVGDRNTQMIDSLKAEVNLIGDEFIREKLLERIYSLSKLEKARKELSLALQRVEELENELNKDDTTEM